MRGTKEYNKPRGVRGSATLFSYRPFTMNDSSGRKMTHRSMAALMARRAGVRLTSQRRAVLEAVVASRDHPTASLIYERARTRVPGISLATIYNCLEAMTKAHVINQLRFDGGPSRFCPNLVPHVHVMDEINNKVIDVHLKPGLTPEDIFDLPEGVCITSMEACLHGHIPDNCPPHFKK